MENEIQNELQIEDRTTVGSFTFYFGILGAETDSFLRPSEERDAMNFESNLPERVLTCTDWEYYKSQSYISEQLLIPSLVTSHIPRKGFLL